MEPNEWRGSRGWRWGEGSSGLGERSSAGKRENQEDGQVFGLLHWSSFRDRDTLPPGGRSYETTRPYTHPF